MRFPNLPLNCWSTDSLSIIGVPLYADECTSRQLRVSFARLLIEMDVTQELPKSVFIEDPSGKVVEQQVHYEWAPPFCQTCKKVGHNCKAKKDGQKKQKKQWVPKQVQPSSQAAAEVQATNEADQVSKVAGSIPAVVGGQVGTPTPAGSALNVEQNDGWRTVSRPVRDKGKRPVSVAVDQANSYMAFIVLKKQMRKLRILRERMRRLGFLQYLIITHEYPLLEY